MKTEASQLDTMTCQRARLARDARFDGRFFIAVKTTGIYCRPICPASPPKESNVTYFDSAIGASQAGFRPCLRCRPDSAPSSPAWQGTDTTIIRALKLIDEGALNEGDISTLASRLGISDRYLRQLFKRHLGITPTYYAQHQRCLLAKKLLHESHLPIHEIAIASGFNSVRRFNEVFKKIMTIPPSQIRRTQGKETSLTLQLAYRPPFDWVAMFEFLKMRCVEGLEWIEDNVYCRTFAYQSTHGIIKVSQNTKQHCLNVVIDSEQLKDIFGLTNHLRRCFDLDSDSFTIERYIGQVMPSAEIHSGLRIPSVWSIFEAGIRAICGQQVSVSAAHRLVSKIVTNLGSPFHDHFLFPAPQVIADSELAFLKMPLARKETLRNFARWFINDFNESLIGLSDIKGIGPWTIDYLKMRGLSDSDIWLASDLGVKNALKKVSLINSPSHAQPFRSYLTFQLWRQLN